MLFAGKIDGLFDLVMLLWVSARGLTRMGAETTIVLTLAGILLAVGVWYFMFRSREA